MNDNRFDDILRSKLSNLQSADQPQWDLFLEKKAAAQEKQNDIAFDQKVRHQLEGLEARYNPAHWNLLQERIDEIIAAKKKVLNIKLLEFSFLLILVIGVGYGVSFQEQYKFIEHPIADLNNDKTEIIGESFNQENSDYNKSIVNSSLPEEKTLETKTASVNDSQQKSSQQLTRSNQDRARLEKSANQSTIPGNNHAFTSDNSLSNDVNSEVVRKNLEVMGLPLQRSNDQLTLEGINRLGLLAFESDLAKIDLPQDFGIVPQGQINPSYTSIQLYTTFDNNLIHTPNDLEYNTQARTTEMYGYTIGLLISKYKNSFELETGFAYSSVNKPWDFNLTFGDPNGFFSFRMTNVHFDIVSIPVNVKYHFVETPEWSMFMKLGLHTSIVANASYETEHKFLGGGAVLPGQEPEIPDNIVSPFEQERYFTNGVFNGDNISQNIFLQATVGLGIERFITSDFSVYFSGDYHNTIHNGQLGPNNDAINKIGISLGFKKIF